MTAYSIILLICFALSNILCDTQLQSGNLDDLINQIFTPPPDYQPQQEITPDKNGAIIDRGIVTGAPGPIPGLNHQPTPSVPFPMPVPTQPPVHIPTLPGPIPIQPNPAINPCIEGECVPYYLCANGSIITDGEGLLDIRFGGDNNPNPEFHPCSGVFETCCTMRSEKPILPAINHQEGCGYRNKDGVGFRITGDQNDESQFAEFPWMVAILKEEQILQQIVNIFQCGGSLIHPSVVLTAAHCVSGKEPYQLKIRLGEWDTQTKDEIFPHQDRLVDQIIIHPEYYKGALYNDIALLFLTEPAQYASNVNTICLPPQDFTFDGSRCVASGWGKNSFGKTGQYQVILKKIELPVVPRAKCVVYLRETRLGVHFELHRSFICAGGEKGRDTCKGDGGSPLVCPIPNTVNRYYQAGIVSWGIGCGDVTPGVYVNVPVFRNWIDEQIHSHSLQSTSYTP